MPEALIELTGVAKRFASGTLALADCSMRIAPGEFVTLLGPSGCGKSTVLRMIAGLIRPDAGTLRVGTGRSDSDSPRGGPDGDAAARQSGAAAPEQPVTAAFVFQEPTLMPWAPVFDNVWLPLRIAGQSRAQAREAIEAALETVGLIDFAQAWPRELSGGMKMRVSIARALVARPRLLLMDEPFAALDEITRMRLNDDLLRWWRGSGLTVVFVTHSVLEAMFLSERVLVMSARPGRVVAEFTVDAPYPRDDDFRTSQPFARLCTEASHALRATMGDTR
jgi:NitT/TauT family transport system ATP-binding protein